MCLNCGCGMPDTRHKDTDLTREDILRAANGQGMTVEETTSNLVDAFGRMQSEAVGAAGQSRPSGTQTRPR